MERLVFIGHAVCVGLCVPLAEQRAEERCWSRLMCASIGSSARHVCCEQGVAPRTQPWKTQAAVESY